MVQAFVVPTLRKDNVREEWGTLCVFDTPPIFS
jgi:hypothetical protein